MCEAILQRTEGNLRNKSFLPVIADAFGPQGIRNVDNDLKISQVQIDPHDISVVFTGAVYDVIVDTFEHGATRANLQTDAQVLHNVGRRLSSVTLIAFKMAPRVKVKIRDVALGMISVETEEFIKASLKKHFERRELVDLDVKARPRVRPELNMAASCCSTLQMMLARDSPAEAQTHVSAHPHAQVQTHANAHAQPATGAANHVTVIPVMQ